jgi:nucleoside phosphorylase
MLVILAATGKEMSVLDNCPGRKVFLAANGLRAWQMADRKITAVQTGMGKDRTRKAIDSICRKVDPEAFLSIGFCGALKEGLSTGDLAACSTFASEEGQSSTRTLEGRLWEYCIQAMDGTNWTEGRQVTISRVASKPAVKTELSRRSGAEVCQMEDYWIAFEAKLRGLPFGSVRAVFDEFSDNLEGFDMVLDDNGDLALGKLAAYFLRHPRKLAGARNVYQKYLAATSALSGFMNRFMEVYGAER